MIRFSEDSNHDMTYGLLNADRVKLAEKRWAIFIIENNYPSSFDLMQNCFTAYMFYNFRSYNYTTQGINSRAELLA